MLRNFIGFHDSALKAVAQGDLTFAKIKDSAADLMFKLSQMKFEVCLTTLIDFVRGDYGPLFFQSPSQGAEPIKRKLEALHTEIQDKFRQMVE